MAVDFGAIIEDVVIDEGLVSNIVVEVKNAVAQFPTAGSFQNDAKIVAVILPDLGALVDDLRAQLAALKASGAPAPAPTPKPAPTPPPAPPVAPPSAGAAGGPGGKPLK